MDLDRVKLTKVLMLSTSDADGEALNAIRRANAMLKAAKLNWEEFLRPGANAAVSQDWGADFGAAANYYAPPRKPRRAEWNENAKGNWVKRTRAHGVVTVFRDRSGLWKWVNDGQFGAGWPDAEQARDAWEAEELGRE